MQKLQTEIVETTILRERLLSADEMLDIASQHLGAPLSASMLTSIAPLLERPGGVFMDNAHKYDAAGNLYVAVIAHEPANNNITWVEVYYVARGGVWSNTPRWRINPHYKLDSLSVDHTGSTLTFFMTSHGNVGTERRIAVEFASIEGYVSSRSFELAEQEGGEGGFFGQLLEAEPSFTLDEIEARLRRALGVGQEPLTQHFGAHRSFRQGVLEKSSDALLWALDPANADPKAAAIRYLLRYRQIEDGSYSASMSAIRDSGLATRNRIEQALSNNATSRATALAAELPDYVQEALDAMYIELDARDNQKETE